MKYILFFLLIYTQSIQAFNFTLIQNDSISKNIEIDEATDNDSNEPVESSKQVRDRNYSTNYDSYLKVGTYLFIFILGFILAIIYYNHKIKVILHKEFIVYKRNNKKFSVLMIGLIKMLRDKKNEYRTSAFNNSDDKSKSSSTNKQNQPSQSINPVNNIKNTIIESQEENSSPN